MLLKLPDEVLPRVLLFAAYCKNEAELKLTCRSFRAACTSKHLPTPHLALVGGSSNQMGHNATEAVRFLRLGPGSTSHHQWREGAALDIKRSHMACAVIHENLYVIGGTTMKPEGGHRALRSTRPSSSYLIVNNPRNNPRY